MVETLLKSWNQIRRELIEMSQITERYDFALMG